MPKKIKPSLNQKVTETTGAQPDFTQGVMNKVASGEIKMKPHWYFWLGSVLGVVSLLVFSLVSIFLLNIMFFSLRQHGPMFSWRLQQILIIFPWWIVPLAILGIFSSIWLLKQYEFSYKKNFTAIVIAFISVLILAAMTIDQLGLNELWSRRGMMRGFYRNTQFDQQFLPHGQYWRNQR